MSIRPYQNLPSCSLLLGTTQESGLNRLSALKKLPLKRARGSCYFSDLVFLTASRDPRDFRRITVVDTSGKRWSLSIAGLARGIGDGEAIPAVGVVSEGWVR
jgi:hypothetical protein